MLRRLRLFLIGILSVVTCVSASAITRTWTGASSANWSDGANWSPATAPFPGDDLVFTSSALHQTMTNDLPAGTAVGAMTFQSTYTLNGNALTLVGNPSASDTKAINVDLKLGAPVTVVSSVGFYGAIDVNGRTLTLPAGNGLVMHGPVNGTGSIVTGVLYATVDGNFSGTVTGWLD